MTDTPADLKPLEGSHRTPSFEHAEVRDALRLGVITCLPDTSMEAVARIDSSRWRPASGSRRLPSSCRATTCRT
jgi:hypothetical protein